VSHHQKLIEEIVGKIEIRRNSYGLVLVKSAIVKHDDVWENSVTKILPLHKSDSYVTKEKLDYGNLVLFEGLISLDSLVEIIKKLPEKRTSTITLGDYEVQVEGEGLQNGYKYDSGEEYLSVGWFFERYHYRSPPKSYPREPIVSKHLPLFPDFRSAINERIGIDIARYSDLYGIVICLPKYGAKIGEVNIGSTEIRLKIQPKDTGIENIIGKLYCERGKEVRHADIEFEDDTGIASIGFKPDSMYVTLVSKTDNELLDSRRYYSSWESLPKGVVIDIPEYEIRELIRHGETETVEFKEKISKPEEFVETVVAFANTKGGIILLGVDDHSKVIGLPENGYEDTITNILRSHCSPQVNCEMSRKQLDEKDIIVIRVEEGKDKPYFVEDKGPYIRANATDRIATRYEIDEIYRGKQSGYRPY
jgi:hypothetical protein